MYKKKNFFHGIMFHHFHDDKIYSRGQGSINKDDFYNILNYIGTENIINADIFFEKLKKNRLKSTEVCLTFDDGIKSQIDVALPVLEDLKIKSFFFVYTSIFDNKPDYLEVFRFFRMNYYKCVDEFYNEFYKSLDEDLSNFFQNNKKNIELKKSFFSYYSLEDIKFRLVRDIFLNKKRYEEIMFQMMSKKKFDYKNFLNKLFFQKEDLIKLDKLGHLVGLHSHNHPTMIEKLDYDDQKKEYEQSLNKISKILNKSKDKIKFMSHPCGSYNRDTLEILKKLGIELGFKQIMSVEENKGMKSINNTHLEIARENHSKIFKEMY